MFGYFRFFLATLVLLSHIGINIQGVNPGVAAVVSFYMLAGFVVCNLFSKISLSGNSLYMKFYYERVLRIFPQYIFIVILTLIFIVVTQYGSPVLDVYKLARNIIIIPLNYYMFIDNSILQNPKWWLVPPAWSLGVELQAYFILPFIIYFKSLKIFLAIISLCLFVVASFGVINTDYFGYRLLPGVLFIFILGVAIFNSTSNKINADWFDNYFFIVVYVFMVFLLIVLGVLKMLIHPFVRETIFGILIGMPIIIYLAKSKIKLPFNYLLGDLSYGLFLSHFLVIWVVDYYDLINKSIYFSSYVFFIFSISLLISITGVFMIEKNMKKYRFDLFSKE